MIRKTFFLDKEQINFLESLPGTSSEHVRQAINDYKNKLKHQNVSASQSVRKEDYCGETNN